MASKDEQNPDLDWLYAGHPAPEPDPDPDGASADPRFPGRQSVTWSETEKPPAQPRTPARSQEPVQNVSDEEPSLSATRGARQAVTWSETDLPANPPHKQQSVTWSEEDVAIQPAPRPRKDPGAPKAPRPPRKKGNWKGVVRSVFLTVGTILLAWVLFLGLAGFHAWSQIEIVDSTPIGSRPDNQPGTTFLLVGTDERVDQDPAEPVRADSMMIFYIPRNGRSVLISLPRDSYVPIPGVGNQKLNAAYAFGGPQLLTETVELITGLRIDGYIEVGFGGFTKVIDSLGGVEMCLEEAMFDELSELDLPAGCQRLNGTDALAYARMRYSDARGDLGRVERQQQLLKSLANEAATPSTVLNPIRYWRFTHSFAETLKRGDKTSIWTMFSAARGALSFARGDALNFTVPISNPDADTDAGSSVLWDSEQALQLFDEIARGDTSQLDRFVP